MSLVIETDDLKREITYFLQQKINGRWEDIFIFQKDVCGHGMHIILEEHRTKRPKEEYRLGYRVSETKISEHIFNC